MESKEILKITYIPDKKDGFRTQVEGDTDYWPHIAQAVAAIAHTNSEFRDYLMAHLFKQQGRAN